MYADLSTPANVLVVTASNFGEARLCEEVCAAADFSTTACVFVVFGWWSLLSRGGRDVSCADLSTTADVLCSLEEVEICAELVETELRDAERQSWRDTHDCCLLFGLHSVG